MPIPDGEPVHGELSTADATTAAPLVLYGAAPKNATTARPARVLGTTERLIITDYQIITGATGMSVTLFTDDDANSTVAAGERVAAGTFAANSGIAAQLGTPHYCCPGKNPKVKSSAAGQLDVVIHGVIVRS